MTDDTPLFTPERDGYVPSGFTRGPWDPGLLHGGAAGALFAEALQAAQPDGFQPARLTLDLIRPVPLEPLVLALDVVRDGRRLRVDAGTLSARGKPVARATLASIAPRPLDGPVAPPLDPPPDGPDQVDTAWAPPVGRESFVGGAMEFRFTRQVAPGHGIAWLRLHRRVLPDLLPSPLARAVAAADVGNAVSARRESSPRISFVNADLSLSLSRVPEGEWIRLESFGRWEPNGIGWVRSAMSDHAGEVGAVSNALVLEPATGFVP